MKKTGSLVTFLLIISITSLLIGITGLYGVIKHTPFISGENPVPENSVVVHISTGTDNKHAIMMGLNTAKTFLDAGTEVFVFFDVKGVQAVVENSNFVYMDFPPSHQLINELIERGAKVSVCKHCLMIEGFSLSNVIAGVTELDKTEILKMQSKKIITLDY